MQIFSTDTKKTRTAIFQGTTLVEILVTLAIFAAVTVVVVGAFIAVLSMREQSNVTQNAYDNVRLTLDVIEREIQSSTGIYTASCSSDTCAELKLVVGSSDGGSPHQVQYKLSGGSILKAVQTNISGDGCASLQADGTFPEFCFQPITGGGVNISVLSFSVRLKGADGEQSSPIVTVGIVGDVQDSSGNTTPLKFSTTASPRNKILVGNITESGNATPPDLTLLDIETPVGCSVAAHPGYGNFDTNVPNYPASGYYITDCFSVNLVVYAEAPNSGLRYVEYTNSSGTRARDLVPGYSSHTATFSNVPITSGQQEFILRAENLMGQSRTSILRIENQVIPPACAANGAETFRAGGFSEDTLCVTVAPTNNLAPAPNASCCSGWNSPTYTLSDTVGGTSCIWVCSPAP